MSEVFFLELVYFCCEVEVVGCSLVYYFCDFGLCRGYQQQDAHEFLRYMLDRLHTELLHLLPDFTLKDNPYISLGHKSRSSIVTSVFGGTLQSEVSIY